MTADSSTGWHRDLPAGVRGDIMDIIAKVLLVRLGGSVSITSEEIHEAAATQAEYGYREGTLLFRVERH